MNILAFAPELILIIGSIFVLMTDVFLGKKLPKISRVLFISSLIFSVVALFITIEGFGSSDSAFKGMFFVNRFTSFSKIVILSTLLIVLFMSADFIEAEKRISAEFISLVILASVGGMLMISSNNLLPIYLGLEMQALSLYLLAAIKRDSTKSSESGVKYFILGSVASAILLFGISMIYGFTGTIDLTKLGQYYQINHGNIPIAVYLGFTLVMVAMFFKVSAAPFHMWTPDVYEGSTTIVTTFFATAVKFIAIIMLLRLYFSLTMIWPDMYQIIVTVSILSLVVGSLGAIRQTNLKRMLAYSAIGHVGFIFAGLAVANLIAIKAILLYSIIYVSLSLGAFAFLMMLESEDKNNVDESNDHLYQLSSIAGLAKASPIAAMSLAVIMFSLAGIPPFAGFFAKFYILLSVVGKGWYFLAVIAVLASVISAFYYLRIVKIIYFDKGSEDNKIILSINNSSIVLISMALANLLFLAYLTPITNIIARVL